VRAGRSFLAPALSLAALGLRMGVVQASHLEGLREAGETPQIGTGWLIGGGILAFSVMGCLIVLGLRYLERLKE